MLCSATALKDISMIALLRRYLSNPRGAPFAVLFAVGTVGLIISFAWWGHANSKSPAESVLGLVLNISATFFVVGLVEVVTQSVQIRREGPARPLFKEFFGHASFSDGGLPTIFMNAGLTQSPGSPPHARIADIVLYDPPDAAGLTRPKGIRHIIAFEDLEGVLLIDREFQRYGAKLRIELDNYKSMPLPEDGCLAIGLGYNNVTLRLMEACPELYKVTYDEVTDDFHLCNRDWGASQACDDYALIARVLVSPSSARKPTPYIVCAGHTADATAWACKYVARNWLILARLYDKKRRLNECSMAVILRFNARKEETPTLGQPWFALVGQHHVSEHTAAGNQAPIRPDHSAGHDA